MNIMQKCISYECAMKVQYNYPSNQTCIKTYKHTDMVSLFHFKYSGYVNVLPDITVNPNINSYELLNLQSGSIYCVQLSAYTAAGEGKRSEPKCFETLGKFFHANP